MAEQENTLLKVNEFYRDAYRSMVGWMLRLAILAAILSGIFVYSANTKSSTKFYASTATGRIVRLHSLSEPVITVNYMLRWASIAVRTAFNLNFAQLNADLKKATPYFTPEGWRSFNSALKDSGYLGAIQSKKLIMQAVVSGSPVVLSASLLDGRYTWMVQMPLLVTFTSASEKINQHMLVTLRVERVPVINAPGGIQITDFSANPKYVPKAAGT